MRIWKDNCWVKHDCCLMPLSPVQWAVAWHTEVHRLSPYGLWLLHSGRDTGCCQVEVRGCPFFLHRIDVFYMCFTFLLFCVRSFPSSKQILLNYIKIWMKLYFMNIWYGWKDSLHRIVQFLTWMTIGIGFLYYWFPVDLAVLYPNDLFSSQLLRSGLLSLVLYTIIDVMPKYDIFDIRSRRNLSHQQQQKVSLAFSHHLPCSKS